VLALAGSAIQLVPDGTLVLHLLLIVMMVGLLNATLLRPINRILKERERRTKGSSAEAQNALKRAGEKALDYQRRLREARTLGYALLEDERRTASRDRDLKVAGVKAEITRWIEQEKDSLGIEAEAAKSSLVNEAEARAFEIGSRILGRAISRG
jgi:F0F1-type ATP synthase membrane subunit b/b'